jgi:hypothetical protein
MEVTAFWDETSSLTNVSGKIIASIFMDYARR